MEALPPTPFRLHRLYQTRKQRVSIQVSKSDPPSKSLSGNPSSKNYQLPVVPLGQRYSRDRGHESFIYPEHNDDRVGGDRTTPRQKTFLTAPSDPVSCFGLCPSGPEQQSGRQATLTSPEPKSGRQTTLPDPGQNSERQTTLTGPGEKLERQATLTAPGEKLERRAILTAPGEKSEKQTTRTGSGQKSERQATLTGPGEKLERQTTLTVPGEILKRQATLAHPCLLYTSDAADDC